MVNKKLKARAAQSRKRQFLQKRVREIQQQEEETPEKDKKTEEEVDPERLVKNCLGLTKDDTIFLVIYIVVYAFTCLMYTEPGANIKFLAYASMHGTLFFAAWNVENSAVQVGLSIMVLFHGVIAATILSLFGVKKVSFEFLHKYLDVGTYRYN